MTFGATPGAEILRQTNTPPLGISLRSVSGNTAEKKNHFSHRRAVNVLALPNARVFTACLLGSRLGAPLAPYLCLVLSLS